MPECQRLPKCIFFNDQMANMPAVSTLYKQRFCKSEFENCARFMVAAKLGPEKVPPDLFPNQFDRAQLILRSANP